MGIPVNDATLRPLSPHFDESRSHRRFPIDKGWTGRRFIHPNMPARWWLTDLICGRIALTLPSKTSACLAPSALTSNTAAVTEAAIPRHFEQIANSPQFNADPETLYTLVALNRAPLNVDARGARLRSVDDRDVEIAPGSRLK